VCTRVEDDGRTTRHVRARALSRPTRVRVSIHGPLAPCSRSNIVRHAPCRPSLRVHPPATYPVSLYRRFVHDIPSHFTINDIIGNATLLLLLLYNYIFMIIFRIVENNLPGVNRIITLILSFIYILLLYLFKDFILNKYIL